MKQAKLDLDGNPIVIRRCKHCGKEKGDHLAKTFNCPIGPKSKSMGYTNYAKHAVYEAKP